MLIALLTATAYLYFHWSYFALVKGLVQMPKNRIWMIFLGFAVNYAFFVLCSVLELSLIVNWFLFSLLLWLETYLYGKGDGRNSLFCALMGVIYGLAVNIFCRSVIAIVMDEPLQSFDNHVSNVANLKWIPISLGFLLAGLVIQLLSRPVYLEQLRLILSHRKHQSFLLKVMVGLFCYLFLNLLLYSTPLNDIILKIWSLKSCVFTVVGFYIAVRYTRRICELSDYREKNRAIARALREGQKKTEQLKRQAVQDALTGLGNRGQAEETIASMLRKKTRFSLCFFDLDGLKKVNDRYGHEEGDRYILTVAERFLCVCRNGQDILFRYGGDEFLILFPGMEAGEAERRAEAVNETLRTVEEGVYPYPLSFSYGIVESRDFSDEKDMIGRADQKMYGQKHQKQAARDSRAKR